MDRLYSINVRGTFLCYKYAATQMIAQGRGGRIIGATSATGKRGKVSSYLVSSKSASQEEFRREHVRRLRCREIRRSQSDPNSW